MRFSSSDGQAFQIKVRGYIKLGGGKTDISFPFEERLGNPSPLLAKEKREIRLLGKSTILSSHCFTF